MDIISRLVKKYKEYKANKAMYAAVDEANEIHHKAIEEAGYAYDLSDKPAAVAYKQWIEACDEADRIHEKAMYAATGGACKIISN